MIQPEEEPEESYAMDCDTVRNVISEIKLGDKSKFAPFTRYLQTRPKGVIPDEWSNEGRRLIGKIVGRNLPPDDLLDKQWISHWQEFCEGGKSEFENHIAAVVVAYAEDELMIPYFDILNHRNGEYLNTLARKDQGDKFTVTAKRTILPGEEIYSSVNMCNLCGGRESSYHTPDIVRDYGFVEEYPQRFQFGPVLFNLDETIQSGKLKLSWSGKLPTKAHVPSLQIEYERLEKITPEKQNRASIPDHEWNVIWDFHKSVQVALSTAIRVIESMSQNEDPDAEVELFVTCDRYMEFPNFEDDIANVESMYQEISFSQNVEDDDMCMSLDNTLQICQGYRPHYHDYFVHFSSNYMKELKRVVFVGGGDAMLLHEVLKYPNVELVLGLELDQTVVRQSFKYFHTQPHFDDERVQWWFGDASKSINILPKEFFGSFDLVLVDLSETVMSFTVNKHLDILGALALLLKPDGIFVKNELYMKQLSNIFDHTIELYMPQVPFICDQDWVMGSNKQNFLEPYLNSEGDGNDVEAFLYEPAEHFEAVKHYSKNKNPTQQVRCEDIETLEDISDEVPRGVLMVVEAEDATAQLEDIESLKRELLKILKNVGLTPISTLSHPSEDDGDVVVIVMREGLVNVHTWPEHNYCAFDIQLWGGFDKVEKTRIAILEHVGSKKGSWSSFRVIVGGMLATNTFTEDRKLIGPDMKRACVNSSDKDALKYAKINDSTFGIMMEESLNLVQHKDSVVVVICGDHTQHSCTSLDIVKKDQSFVDVVAFWTCPADESSAPKIENESNVKHVMLCGKDLLTALKETVKEHYKIGTFVIDSTVSTDMVKEAKGIYTATINVWNLEVKEGDMVEPIVTFLLPSLDHTRRKFLSMGADKLLIEPVAWAEINLSDSNDSMNIGVLSSGDPTHVSRVINTVHAIEKRSGVKTELIKLRGHPATDHEDFDPTFFRGSQFEHKPALEQYANQQPLGHQSIFQLEKTFDGEISTVQLKRALDTVVADVGGSLLELATFDDLGKGTVLVAILDEGHIIVVWDGDKNVDFNIFIYDEEVDHQEQIVEPFMNGMGGMKVVLRDEHPRGIGKVVNFLEDMIYGHEEE